ncbi:MAG: hypothetical protein NUW07_07775 [Candidatus Saccharicenans sp.]|jgi:hypothetical protein|nr:hypothetical protein [Candidatus Saccharicenans sp.]MDH7493974.1 hypothetical protein [Candidatus Saccharicenans sp.]
MPAFPLVFTRKVFARKSGPRRLPFNFIPDFTQAGESRKALAFKENNHYQANT